jgi:non-heme chloroperoxidase
MMPFFNTNDGATIFYKDWGKGKPVVFVHAWAMTSVFWEYMMLHLNSQGLRCIAYDRRGHGKSDDPGGGYDFDTLTDDLHCLLEALDLQDVTLVGHSMGGGEGIRYQTRYGSSGRVTRLALLATADYLRRSADNPDGIDGHQLDDALATISGNFLQWLYDNVAPFYLPDIFGVSEDVIRWTIDMMLETSMRAVVDCQQQVMDTDLRREAQQITIPVLIIHGDRDASIPYHCGQALSAMIPRSIFRTYHGAPHGFIVTHANQLKKDLLSFINDEQ